MQILLDCSLFEGKSLTVSEMQKQLQWVSENAPASTRPRCTHIIQGKCLGQAHMSRNVRKRTFWQVRPKSTQIRLCIRIVLSESSFSAWRNFASLAIQNAPSEDSDLNHHRAHMSEGTRFLTMRLILLRNILTAINFVRTV